MNWAARWSPYRKRRYKYYILDKLLCFQFIAKLVFSTSCLVVPVVNCPISRRGIANSRDTLHRMHLDSLPVPFAVPMKVYL
jgi:hypothetical protein